MLLKSPFLIFFISPLFYNFVTSEQLQCDKVLSNQLKDEINSYQEVATKIMDEARKGTWKGRTYKNLAKFTDKFGSRITGSEALEKSIDWAISRFGEDQLENVKTEEVNIDRWVRGKEKATLLTPRKKNLKIIGLGLGAPTPPEGITARALVVKTFAELEARKSEAAGKIVVFNQDYGSNYLTTVSYRTKGVIEAAKVGAVATLVRSVTPFSINSPHTGYVKYSNDTKAIPVAALTHEDAEFLWRLEQLKEEITIELLLEAKWDTPSTSRHVWGDITGKSDPNNLVISGCHIDSWDVGEGVMDDAGGCFVTLEAANLLNHLKLRPKRTIRNFWFTAEEVGMVGCQQYVDNHIMELGKIDIIMESDFGTFKPRGVKFSGVEKGACIVQQVLSLLKEINATEVLLRDNTGGDTTPFVEKGVPGIMMNTDDNKYMWFHHTEGDTMTVYKPEEMDDCLAMWAVATYVIADLSVDLPRM